MSSSPAPKTGRLTPCSNRKMVSSRKGAEKLSDFKKKVKNSIIEVEKPQTSERNKKKSGRRQCSDGGSSNADKDREKEKKEASTDDLSGKKKKGLKQISSDVPSETGKGGENGLDNEKMATICKGLIEHKWFHGVMPRDEINTFLENEGEFLVRKTTEKNRPIICLSVRHKDDVRHFPLQYENGQWFLRNMEKNFRFFEISELLDFLVSKKYQLQPSNAICVKTVPRPDYYILHEDITLESKLGSGAFGEVWKGRLRKINDSSHAATKCVIDVAVKRMKGNPTKALISEFVKEAKLMRSLQHINIVMVHGVAPSEEPLMIVIELAANGCLKSFLKKTPNCPVEKLHQFSSDAARGMCYLSCQLIIHRDLAARNLLLGSNYEVKISDFGLSEHGKKEIKINRMKLPIRWLAPETLDTGIFTTKTDVWSFAVTLWEIFSRCASDPFPGLTNQQAKEMIRTTSPPMQAPPEAPPLVISLMLDIFVKNPVMRPTFTAILKRLCPSEDVTIYEADQEQNTQKLSVQSHQKFLKKARSTGNLSRDHAEKKPTRLG